jgi:hypothetical protein
VAPIKTADVGARIVNHESISGVGAPPLWALAALLSLLAAGPALSRRNVVLAVCGTAWLIALNFVALTRGLWIVTGVMLVAATFPASRRLPLRVALRFGVATLAICTVGVASAVASSGWLRQQLEARVSSPTRQVVSLAPPTINFSSIDERRWEAGDATLDLVDHGVVSVLLGRGSGSEYRTALPRIENTSSEGRRHQIHITWVAALYRNGIVGLTALCAIIALAAVGSIRLLRASRTAAARSRVVALALVLWLLGSTIALADAYGFFGNLQWALTIAMIGGLTLGSPGNGEPHAAGAP